MITEDYQGLPKITRGYLGFPYRCISDIQDILRLDNQIVPGIPKDSQGLPGITVDYLGITKDYQGLPRDYQRLLGIT